MVLEFVGFVTTAVGALWAFREYRKRKNAERKAKNLEKKIKDMETELKTKVTEEEAAGIATSQAMIWS